MARATFNQINLVVSDFEAALRFYRLIGLDIPEDAAWRSGGKAHHIKAQTADGVDLEIDSHALARRYNEGFRAERGRVIVGVSLESREAVDETYAEVIGAGHQGLQVPYDAFWGARYAIVEDPDGNPVGLTSPVDAARRSPPPQL